MMSAKGKITTSEIGHRPLGTVRILITDDRLGLAASAAVIAGTTADTVWYPARNQTGMVVATVQHMEGARGNRRSRYYLQTDRGWVNNLSPSQTFWLAPDTATTPPAPGVTRVDEAPTRITVKQLRYTQGVRVLLAKRHTTHAGGGAGQWTAARTAPPRGGALSVPGEPADVHAATVTDVRLVTEPGAAGTPRYDVVTNLGTVERVTAGQAFRLAPADKRDTADVRAELAADRKQREDRTAVHLAELREQAAERDAQAERDREEARRFLAEIAPESASSEPSDRVRIERHRASVTQGEVSVFLDGELLGRYGDQVDICTAGHGHEPGTHEDGAVCFGGFHGLGDARWYEVANRIAARRALAEPVYTARACAGVEFHALADVDADRTACGDLSTRTGQIRERAAVVAEHGATPCTTCYPPQHFGELERPAPSFVSGWSTIR